MLNEDHKPIPGYEGLYWAHRDGYITNGRKQMKTYEINSGYLCLKLVNSAGRKSFLLHRLIAEVFIENLEGKEEVNHKDGVKHNCAVTNLEWATSDENKKHAKDTGLWAYNTPTLGVNKGQTSKYRNVTWDKSRQKWIAGIRDGGKTHHQKRFENEDDAALHVNWIIDHMGLDRPKNVII